MPMITKDLLHDIRDQFQINWYGNHGISHWLRVHEIGMRLAQKTGANKRVVQLFAIFHDAGRHNEGNDPQHGPRGADLASHFRYRHLNGLNEEEFLLLRVACCLHTHAATHEDVTIQTCFDSDRLDLGRVGTIPDPRYLCTEAAKSPQMIAWALENSQRRRIADKELDQTVLQN